MGRDYTNKAMTHYYDPDTGEVIREGDLIANHVKSALAALQLIADTPCNHGAQGFCPRTLAREAIAKAEGKVTP